MTSLKKLLLAFTVPGASAAAQGADSNFAGLSFGQTRDKIKKSGSHNGIKRRQQNLLGSHDRFLPVSCSRFHKTPRWSSAIATCAAMPGSRRASVALASRGR